MESPAKRPRLNEWLKGSRHVRDCYQKLDLIDEGMYGVVYRGRDLETNDMVALKRVKLQDELVAVEGFPITVLREINLQIQLEHENVVGVKEVVHDGPLRLYLVMPYMGHDLRSVLLNMERAFLIREVKCLMLQLLSGIQALHEAWCTHRDIKSSNLLLNDDGVLKICDFGLARKFGSPLQPYTPYDQVVTLWYRAPGTATYAPDAVDMWSVGCIFAEMILGKPLMAGRNELEQMNMIVSLLGTPNEDIWPNYSTLPNPDKIMFKQQPYNYLRRKFDDAVSLGRPALSDKGVDLLNHLLTYDPRVRMTATEARAHPFFDEEPRAILPCDMPVLPKRRKERGGSGDVTTMSAILEKEKERLVRVAMRDRKYR